MAVSHNSSSGKECQRTSAKRLSNDILHFYNTSHSYFIDYCLFSNLHCFETRKYAKREKISVKCGIQNTRGPACSHAKILSTRKSEKKGGKQQRSGKSDPRNNVTARHRDYVKLSVKIQSLLTLLEQCVIRSTCVRDKPVQGSHEHVDVIVD